MPIDLPPPEELPGLATAFDEGEMRSYLQGALFGTSTPDYVVERCTPTRPLYAPGESCLLRYRFRARDQASGEILEPLVTGRVFPNERTCASYFGDKLAPLVARMRARPEVAAYAAPAAVIEPLNMVVYVWPVDGELPSLVDATDRARMIELFRETLPFDVEDCRIELVSYRRRQRCVLRYTVAGEEERLIVYGKVSAVGNETPKDVIIGALRRRVEERAVADGLTIPRSLGWRPELQLSLLEALPGEPQIGPALAARLRGEAPAGELALEQMVAACGRTAAAIHTSGVTLGPARTLGDELRGLQREVAPMRRFVPDFGDSAQAWLDRIATLAERSKPLGLRLGHGDFKPEQLLFDGSGSALVDFDAICQAEPALDLGKFLAHLRVETRRLEQPASPPSELGEELVREFLRAYVDAAGAEFEDERRLHERTKLYEAVALLRLTLRSRQNLDEARLDLTAALLEESLAGELEQG